MLLKTAQTNRPGFSQVTEGMYQFFPKHMAAWSEFWKNMDGDRERILAWANDVGIQFPKGWYTALYQFLFNHFSGDEKLLRSAAKEEKFHEFIAQVVENHIKEPQDKWWYINKGVTYDKYIRMMEHAAEISDSYHAVAFINARCRNLGDELYNEYLLGVAGKKAEVKLEADKLNRKAYELERGVYESNYEPGDKVCYSLDPEVDLTVVGAVDNGILAARDTGALSYIEDLWNLRRA